MNGNECCSTMAPLKGFFLCCSYIPCLCFVISCFVCLRFISSFSTSFIAPSPPILNSQSRIIQFVTIAWLYHKLEDKKIKRTWISDFLFSFFFFYSFIPSAFPSLIYRLSFVLLLLLMLMTLLLLLLAIRRLKGERSRRSWNKKINSK